jgi:hypothetical protein
MSFGNRSRKREYGGRSPVPDLKQERIRMPESRLTDEDEKTESKAKSGSGRKPRTNFAF